MSVYRILQWLHIAPGVWMLENPFKIYEFFQVTRSAGLAKQHVIVDLGCGGGTQTQLLARRCGRVIGLDPSEEEIAHALRRIRHSSVQGRVEFICSSLENANLPGTSLDRVYSFCVLEHITNLEQVLSEVFRLLKPGCELHVSVDSLAPVKDEQLLARHKQDNSVVRYFDRDLLKDQLEGAGFQVLEMYPIMTSKFALREFSSMIRAGGYESNLVRAVLTAYRLRNEDRHTDSADGIMLIARARRPV